ncbi:hypothetical protein F4802DRAFT_418678 [Xylaria palmicola]|nr:hypothetical protein F4802DRAFT_418678 [Xylaria palmicola]
MVFLLFFLLFFCLHCMFTWSGSRGKRQHSGHVLTMIPPSARLLSSAGPLHSTYIIWSDSHGTRLLGQVGERLGLAGLARSGWHGSPIGEDEDGSREYPRLHYVTAFESAEGAARSILDGGCSSGL